MMPFRLLGAAIATCLAVPAMAADMRMPVKAPAPVVASAYNWTGFYLGAHVGGAWFNKDWTYPCTSTNLTNFPGFACGVSEGGHSGSSWLAGGQVGFNYQVSQWVWGVEAQFSATRINGSSVSQAFVQDTLHSRTDFIGTIAGRLGVAWDRVLLYAKGGGAWVHDKFWESTTGDPSDVFGRADGIRWGWMVGAGIEYAFAPNWSVKAEYNYLNLGTKRIHFTGDTPSDAFETDIRQRIQLVHACDKRRLRLLDLRPKAHSPLRPHSVQPFRSHAEHNC